MRLSSTRPARNDKPFEVRIAMGLEYSAGMAVPYGVIFGRLIQTSVGPGAHRVRCRICSFVQRQMHIKSVWIAVSAVC